MQGIILFGYRGSGKSTLGRALAEARAWTLRDTDDMVRQRFGGAAIADIWAQHGEPAFRQAESEAVEQALQQGPAVVALGGGAVMHPDTRARLAALDPGAWRRVYLACSVEVLSDRLRSVAGQDQDRPSLTGIRPAWDPQEITRVLSEREPVYKALADRVVDVSAMTGAKPAVDAVLATLE